MRFDMHDLRSKISEKLSGSAGGYGLALIELVLGLLFLVSPSGTVSIVFRLAGLLCVLLAAWRYLQYRKAPAEMGSVYLIPTALLAFLGLSLLINPRWPIQSATFVIGIIIVVYGVYNVYLSKERSGADSRAMKAGMIAPAVYIIVGAILIVMPRLAVNTVLRLLGIALLFVGGNSILNTRQDSARGPH